MSSPDDSRKIAVVIYAVRSAKATENEEVEQQISAIEQKLADDADREIIAVYHEDGRSGSRGNRGPELERAMEHAAALAEEGRTVELWAWKSNRLGRGSGRKNEARSVTEVLTVLRRKGVTVRSVADDEFVTNQMLWGFAAEQAAKYAEDLSTDTRRGKRARVARGEQAGGPPNDGYRLEIVTGPNGEPMTKGGRVVHRRVLDPARVPVIERIYDLADGGHTPGEIARTLRDAGLRTRTGAAWRPRAVRAILRCPFYAGWITDNGERVEGVHEPLIERERWERIQSKITRADPAAVQRQKAGATERTPYLLRRLTFCEDCGAPMYTRNTDAARTYVCRTRREHGACSAPIIDAEQIESAIMLRLDRFIDADLNDWLQRRLDEHRSDQRLVAGAVDREHKRLVALQREYEQAQARVLRYADNPDREVVAIDMATAAKSALDEQQRALDDASAQAAEWTVEADPTIDALLDFYNGVIAAVRNRTREASGVEELRAALADLLVGIWLRTDEAGTVTVRFVLRESEAILAGRRSAEYTFPMIAAQARNLPGLLERGAPGRIGQSTNVDGSIQPHGIEMPPLVIPGVPLER